MLVKNALLLHSCSRRVLTTPPLRFLSQKLESSFEDGLEVLQNGSLRILKLNRPKKFNAFNQGMYAGVQLELEKAAADENTSITALTGAGDYFSSGNDLNMFQKIPQTEQELREFALDTRDQLFTFVTAFIDHPKPLVGVLNGPAIGIGASITGLMDIVYASNSATLSLPFVRLGQGPEGCSSYMFPRIMGPAKANEIIYFGRQVSAEEADKLGIFTRVVPQEDLDNIWTELAEMAKLPKASLLHCKHLSRGVNKEILHAVNKKECDMLVDRWASPETFKAVSKMFLKKKKKE